MFAVCQHIAFGQRTQFAEDLLLAGEVLIHGRARGVRRLGNGVKRGGVKSVGQERLRGASEYAVAGMQAAAPYTGIGGGGIAGAPQLVGSAGHARSIRHAHRADGAPGRLRLALPG